MNLTLNPRPKALNPKGLQMNRAREVARFRAQGLGFRAQLDPESCPEALQQAPIQAACGFGQGEGLNP